MEFVYELRIPKERIAVLIGKEGNIKKEVETTTKTKIKIDSKEGDIFISGEDGLGLYNAREVIKAIGRGFNPDVAGLLLKPDYVFEMVNISDYTKKSRDNMVRLKGRVIGSEGKCRKLIEKLSECYISVYGKTVSIIGTNESASVARHAVEALLGGSTHANVYKWLEKRRREIKRTKILESI
jgi:ribosomal RNA assembly protein|tara:strand:- start:88 stop:633 length:546 start_codon:yes stop_codon:yes gene_type:complete